MTLSEPPAGSLCLVNVWGRYRPLSPPSRELRAVELGIASRELCDSAYADKGGNIEDVVCVVVSGGGKDFCTEDSGGPLVFGDQLVGFASWGMCCASANYPGLYSNVATLKSFVTEQTGVQ